MTSLKLNRRSKVWINPPGHRIISQQKLSLRQFYNLTNFSKVHLMEAAPLTFLYLSNELVSTFICNSYKYISELQQLHLESRNTVYSWETNASDMAAPFDIPVSFKWVVGDIHLRSIQCNPDSHLLIKTQMTTHKKTFVVNLVFFLCCVA